MDTSCPRCAAGVAQGASSCGDCGFVFFEDRRRPRLPWRRMLVAAVVAGAVVAAGVLLTRDSPPGPPGPVAGRAASERLERQLHDSGIADLRTVECGGAVHRGALTRCLARYDGGDTQLLLVALTASGELDIQNPYPAQRRPGG
jgi:hypothetical protein